MTDIVEWGRSLFADREELTIEGIRERIEAQSHEFHTNDWGVLKCIAEDDAEIYEVLQELDSRRMATMLVADGFSEYFGYRNTAAVLCAELSHALAADIHFGSRDRLTKIVMREYRTVFGERWGKLCDAVSSMSGMVVYKTQVKYIMDNKDIE